MITFYSEEHHLHHGNGELINGELKPCFEKPMRAVYILRQILERKLGEVCESKDFGINSIETVHTKEYLNFFQGAWSRWVNIGGEGDILPFTWPARALRQDRVPDGLNAQLGYYSFDAGAPLTAGTWRAAYSSSQVALSAQELICSGANSAFALCRPPGHHAAKDVMGGYCYLNNAAIATEAFLQKGAKKVAILDVDYHHGNGTQSIFYERDDVYFVSIHADPAIEFPFFLGYKEECGIGRGEGYNLNLPLNFGSDWSSWGAALDFACKNISTKGVDAVVVSLGVDTFEKDPISKFKLKTSDYFNVGNKIAKLKLPTLFVMEGGYAVDEIGVNVVNVLEGFEQ